MARVTIAEKLKEDIMKKFKEESKKIFRQMYSLENNPTKGKLLGNVGGIVIKEITRAVEKLRKINSIK